MTISIKILINENNKNNMKIVRMIIRTTTITDNYRD